MDSHRSAKAVRIPKIHHSEPKKVKIQFRFKLIKSWSSTAKKLTTKKCPNTGTGVHKTSCHTRDIYIYVWSNT